MPRLVYLNGAPGTGKSTVAHALSRGVELGLAIDVDQLKHALGGWNRDPLASGLHARRLTLALAGEHLSAGHDVFVGQYAARTAFIEALEDLAGRHSATFHEFILEIGADRLAERLRTRRDAPSRPEHAINDDLLAASDAAELLDSLTHVRQSRRSAIRIDAGGTVEDTVAAVESALHEVG